MTAPMCNRIKRDKKPRSVLFLFCSSEGMEGINVFQFVMGKKGGGATVRTPRNLYLSTLGD